MIFITLGLVVFIAIASIFFLETVTQKYLKFLVGQQVEVMRTNALASSGERMGYLSRDAQFISNFFLGESHLFSCFLWASGLY